MIGRAGGLGGRSRKVFVLEGFLNKGLSRKIEMKERMKHRK